MIASLMAAKLYWLTACFHLPFGAVVCVPVPAGIVPVSTIVLKPGPTWVLVEVLP